MADRSKIEWTNATWNPITGCSVVSPGCTNCYAMALAGTRLRHHPSRAGLTRETKAGPVWTGDVRLNAEWLDQPLRWKRPRRIFVCAHGDLFHEAVPDEWIDRVFAVMALAPQHTFQVLTKRAARMREMLRAVKRPGLPERVISVLSRRAMAGEISKTDYENACRRPTTSLPNVWLGVSAEDQARADERIPHLLATPAAVRFISAEPLLGPIDLVQAMTTDDALRVLVGNKLDGHPRDARGSIHWVIVGGESGPGARPMHPDWARQLRDQCEQAGIPFFFKQWGTPGAPRLLDGCEHNGMPGAREALR